MNPSRLIVVAAFLSAMALSPDSLFGQDSAEAVYRTTNDDVVAQMESRAAEMPEDPATVYYLGLALRDARRFDRARTVLEGLFTKDPANVFIAGALSITASMQFDAKESAVWARRAGENAKPGERESWFAYAQKSEAHLEECDRRRTRQKIAVLLATAGILALCFLNRQRPRLGP